MQNYGKQIEWSTTGSPHPAGGIAENFSYREQQSEYDHDGDDGELHATVLYDKRGEISFSTSLSDDANIPVLGNDSACRIAVTGYEDGGVLLTRVLERWGLNQPRNMDASATHYPDLGAGGAGGDATLGNIDPITSPPILTPGGKLAWGTAPVTSALGIVQSFTIEQTVAHDIFSENGKIVAVVTRMFMMKLDLEVVAISGATLPATGAALTLSGSPARFQTGNIITAAEERARKSQGVVMSISSKWAPAYTAA